MLTFAAQLAAMTTLEGSELGRVGRELPPGSPKTQAEQRRNEEPHRTHRLRMDEAHQDRKDGEGDHR